MFIFLSTNLIVDTKKKKTKNMLFVDTKAFFTLKKIRLGPDFIT